MCPGLSAANRQVGHKVHHAVNAPEVALTLRAGVAAMSGQP